jgi:hypothetical protein
MKQLLFISNVNDGNLQMNVRKQIAEKLPYFNDKRVKITIEKLHGKRSNPQNALLHLLLTIFSSELIDLTGDKDLDLEKVKVMCKLKFLSKDIVNQETGEIQGTYVRKTSELNKEEMGEFIEDVKRYAMDMFGIYLPDANEQIGML